MKKIIVILTISLILSLLISCKEEDKTEKLSIVVSIVPEETFVKAVAGDLVDIVTIIPPGSSPANYEPSPKQMAKIAESNLYFAIGVPAEESNILPNIINSSENIKVVKLNEVVDQIYPARYFDDKSLISKDNEEHSHDDHSHKGRDPHIWMSPKRVVVMITTIRDELIKLDPSNEDIYIENAKSYIMLLNNIDDELEIAFNNVEKKSFIIMHPSMGYFADDYNLNMIPLEKDGKETTASHMHEVIEFALENDIKVIFYQAEFDNKQAETIAAEIDGVTLELKTLSPNYIESLNEIKEVFRKILE